MLHLRNGIYGIYKNDVVQQNVEIFELFYANGVQWQIFTENSVVFVGNTTVDLKETFNKLLKYFNEVL